ncbi:MAG: UDP-3-O-(3-hydroxymyristoyl)glucosamine N-acyltransferase [Acidobacteriota bacterium]|nr:UDP-3-O-(3-hydroxymyristoyl)glucosamine N-acyltransferase [Acidobacteriota bacterium]
MKRLLRQVAEFIDARVVGNPDAEVSGVASVNSAASNDLIFCEDRNNLQEASSSGAAAIIVGRDAAEVPPREQGSKPLLISLQPKLAFARAARFILSVSEGQGEIHPSAVVHPGARLQKNVGLDEQVIIKENVEIGEGTRVGAGCVIAAGVIIGNDCVLHPRVTIYAGARLGDRVIVHSGAVLGCDGFGYVLDPQSGRYEKFPQIGRLEIADDAEIGANTTIDRGALEVTRIGRGTKIDNLVHIGHNCQIGENVVIAAQTGLSGSIVVEDNAVLGGQVGIGEHARIGEGVMLGGQSGVLPQKVLRGKGVAFWGTPARPLREYLRSLAALGRLAKKKSREE